VGRPGYLPGYPQSGSAVSASQSQGYLPQQAPDSGNYPPGPPPPGSGNYPPGPPPLGGIGYPPGAPPSMGPGYAPAGPAYPPPPQQQQQQSFAPPPGPALADTTLEQAESFQQGVRASRSAAEFALREYMTAQHRRHTTGEAGLEEQLRQQARAAVQDLGSLRRDVLSFAKTAERHRWRRWLIGGILCVFPIPRSLGPGRAADLLQGYLHPGHQAALPPAGRRALGGGQRHRVRFRQEQDAGGAHPRLGARQERVGVGGLLRLRRAIRLPERGRPTRRQDGLQAPEAPARQG